MKEGSIDEKYFNVSFTFLICRNENIAKRPIFIVTPVSRIAFIFFICVPICVYIMIKKRFKLIFEIINCIKFSTEK